MDVQKCVEQLCFVQIYHRQARRTAGLLTNRAVIFVTKSGCPDQLPSVMSFGCIFSPGKYLFTDRIFTLFFFAFLLVFLLCFFIGLSEGINDLKYQPAPPFFLLNVKLNQSSQAIILKNFHPRVLCFVLVLIVQFDRLA